MKLVSFCLLIAGAVPAVAAPALFPKPLHLVRRVEDPFSKKPIVVDQYCAGDRVVTVAGNRVTIVDYAAQQMTEIDRAASTYSVTRFDEIARAAVAPAPAAKSATAPKVTPLGMKNSASGRSADSFEIDGGKLKVVAGIDRTVVLSRDAVEVLIGSAYPGVKRPEHDALLGVAAAPRNNNRIAANAATAAPAEYGLPIEQTITMQNDDGSSATTRVSIVRFDNDPPPAALLVISPESKRVESRLSRFAQEMHDADTIPIAPRRP